MQLNKPKYCPFWDFKERMKHRQQFPRRTADYKQNEQTYNKQLNDEKHLCWISIFVHIFQVLLHAFPTYYSIIINRCRFGTSRWRAQDFVARSSQVIISSIEAADLPAPKTGTRLKMGTSLMLNVGLVSASSLNASVKIRNNVS